MGRRKVIDNATLIAAARAVFLEFGAFGTTKEVAKRAGVSEAIIFQRFATKSALFIAAMMPPAPDLATILVTDDPDIKTNLVATGLNMLAYFRTVIPTVMHLITYPDIKMADVIAHHNGNTSPDALNAGIAAYLSELHHDGRANAPVPLATASLFVSAVHSLAIYELMELHGSAPMDHAVAHFVDAMWTGLSPPPAF